MARKERRTPQAATPASAPRPPRRIHWDWIAAAVAFLGLTWFITEGDWNLFASSGFLDSFYDAQAKSLLSGRIDVAPESIAGEAFVRDGKSYGYFGPTPALFRLPFLVLLPGTYGHWSRIAMVFVSMIMLGSLLLLFRDLERQAPGLLENRLWKALAPVLVLGAAFGSTHFYVSAEAKIYYESIAWGGALSFAAAVALVRYLAGRGPRWLALACLTAFLAFFARVSSGAGPIFALFVLDLALLVPPGRFPVWRPELEPRARRQAIATLSATILLTAVLWGALNYWKFGMVFTSQPIAMNLQYTPQRLANVKGELASFHNLPVTLTSYFSPANIRFTSALPWVAMVSLSRDRLAARFPRAHLDQVEQFASLPAALPALLFAALAGTLLCFHRRRKELGPFQLPLLGAVAGCGLLFIWGLLTYRYLHDMFPWLILGTTIALACLATLNRGRMRPALAALFVAGTVYGIWVNTSFGFLQQRLFSWTSPLEKRFGFADMSAATAKGGAGLISHLTHWRGYRPAAALDYGNVQLDRSSLAEAPYVPVLYSLGSPPFMAAYSINVPEEGAYDLAIRYASPDPRPVLLNIDGKDVGYVCTIATGGAQGGFQRWVTGGRHRLQRGDVRLRLLAQQAFPHITMLRLVRAD
jgi:hypothetical protein